MMKRCDGCGREFEAARADARFCSGRCRTIAYRKRLQPDRPEPRRYPLPDQFRRRSGELLKVTSSLGALVVDDRFRRYSSTDDGETMRRQLANMRDELDRIIVAFSGNKMATDGRNSTGGE